MTSLIQRLQARIGALARTLSRPMAFTVALALAMPLLLASCGGVGEDGSGAAPPDTRTTGVVNGFGSVVVNGIHFDVSGADIALDGVAGRSQGDLRVGMVVEVTGSVSADGTTGKATRLVYESLLRGTIDTLPAARTVAMLGQRVSTDDTTVFEGVDGADQLRAGDRLQISGFRDPDGSLRATWVSRESGAGEPQLTGFVSTVAGSVARVAGLDVELAGATLEGVTLATLSTGQLVRVALQAPPVAGAATATRLRLIDTRLPDALRKLQLQGIVAQWDAAVGRFTINGQPVLVGAGTQLQGGTLSDVSTGTRVEVSGTLNNDRALVADKLRFLGGVLTGYGRGKVTAVNVAGRQFNLLDIPGVEVRVRVDTLLNDTAVIGGVLRLDNLNVGDEVLVLGRSTGNRIDAELVQRLPRLSPGAGVGGPVSAVAGTALTVLGVSVATGAATTFFDLQGAPVSPSAFLAALQTQPRRARRGRLRRQHPGGGQRATRSVAARAPALRARARCQPRRRQTNSSPRWPCRPVPPEPGAGGPGCRPAARKNGFRLPPTMAFRRVSISARTSCGTRGCKALRRTRSSFMPPQVGTGCHCLSNTDCATLV